MRATYGIRWQTPSMPGPAYSYCCAKHALRVKGLLADRNAKVHQRPMPDYPEVKCHECELETGE